MRNRIISRTAIAAAGVAGVAAYLASPTRADVAPSFFAATLEPGQSVDVVKTVTLPEATPKLDIVLLVDLSGSYLDDLPNIKALAPQLFDDVRALVPDSRFALATFVDFPFFPWGGSSDYAYRLDQDLTADKAAWLAAVNGMAVRSGFDPPESQYEGLFQAASGAGRQITVDGDFLDPGEIPPGLNPTFRPDATKVIAITTDASFHEGGEAGGPFPYPGATQAETVAALTAAGIKVIAIKAPGSGTEMDQVAADTGGAVVFTDSSSSEIADAIIAGIESLVFTVTAQPSAECLPLLLSYAPASHADVPSGASVSFTETIEVPEVIATSDLDPDGKIVCTVDFKADDTVIGTQVVEVTVPLNQPPVAVCQDLVLNAGPTCLADGDVDGGSFDPDGDPLAVAVSPAGPYPVGVHTVTLTVTDPDGESDSCVATVTVIDVTPPTVVVGPPLELWPPNHRYVDLDLGACVVSVTDACSGELDIGAVGAIVSVYSDEPEDAGGGGDGHTVDDIVIDGPTAFSVRAERQGGGNGRVYGVSFEVDDGAGNVAASICHVTVPHSPGGGAAVDDGPASGYLVSGVP